jgi:aspartyl protease family protein
LWAARPDDGREIKMKSVGGTYTVPVRFNDAITLEATVDSGAAEVVIPTHLLKTLIIAKTVNENDMMDEATYRLADGSEMVAPRFRIRSLQVGNRVLENVVATAAPDAAQILLGQSVLKHFKTVTMDNERQTLLLK